MGKLEGKVAVITGGSSGMALASAMLFVEEGAYIFITGRRQKALDEAAPTSVDEAHAIIGVDKISRGALYHAIENNEVPHLRLGQRILIPRTAFVERLESGGKVA